MSPLCLMNRLMKGFGELRKSMMAVVINERRNSHVVWHTPIHRKTGSCMRARPKGRRTRESQINKHGRKSFTRDRLKPYARRHPMLICWKCGWYQQVDDTTAKILAQMQKAKPARIKERPRRKVSFVILLSQAGAARRNILCFQYRFQCFFFFFCLFFQSKSL